MKRAISVDLINILTLLFRLPQPTKEFGELSHLLLGTKQRIKKNASHASVKHHEQVTILSHNLSGNMLRQISRTLHLLITPSLEQVNIWVNSVY